jgi:hypothetical protein
MGVGEEQIEHLNRIEPGKMEKCEWKEGGVLI